jgi:hypothetical protein
LAEQLRLGAILWHHDKDAPFTKVTINKPGDTERIGLDDLIIGELKPDLVASPTPANDTFIQPYTEDETLDLVDIIVTDPDGETKVSLTLSDPAAGILQAGAVQSSAAGVWEASGTVTDVNALLANLQFVPAADYNSDLIVALEVNDAISGGGSPLTGTINLQGIDVAEDNAITVVNTNDSGLGSCAMPLNGRTAMLARILFHLISPPATQATTRQLEPLRFSRTQPCQRLLTQLL